MDWATLSYNIWSHFPILFSLKLFKLMLEFEWNYNVSSLKMLRYELVPKKSHFLTSSPVKRRHQEVCDCGTVVGERFHAKRHPWFESHPLFIPFFILVVIARQINITN